MSPKIFITGATGYVGGDVLHLFLQTHPSLSSQITCLVRTPSRGQSLLAAYPGIKLATGTLDDSAIIEEEASKADLVLHFASCDHVGAAQAIKNGMAKGSGGILIYTSGTDILLPVGHEIGLKDTEIKMYDDWDNIKECLSFPDENAHRPVDKVVLSTSSSKVKTAVVCPPTIWGVGRGTGNTRSMQLYNLASMILSKGSAIHIPSSSADKLFWPNIHIYDLSPLYIHIIESALTELEGGKGKATWNDEGYYFAENGKHYWQEVAGWISEEALAQGYIKSHEIKETTAQELDFVGVALWNWNVDCKSIRARKLFGWEPKQGTLKDEIPAIVKSEAEKLGVGK